MSLVVFYSTEKSYWLCPENKFNSQRILNKVEPIHMACYEISEDTLKELKELFVSDKKMFTAKIKEQLLTTLL